MNKYIGKIDKYFGGQYTFEIEALDKGEAKEKILEKLKRYDNYRMDTLKIMKVQSFKKKRR